jgi:hypothetical protein
VDYFIQGAQEQITNDILAENFDQGLRAMEAVYSATAISTQGTCPVPSDWISPKVFTVTDDDDTFDLIFKDPEWIYARYSERGPVGMPAYIARDVQAATGSLIPQGQSQTFTATNGQTAFPLTFSAGFQVILAALDGALLPSSDYSIAGSTLTLANGALAGQKLFVQTLPTSAQLANSGNQLFTATAGQTAFALNAGNGSGVLFASLDGVVLTATDYSISGVTLALTNGAAFGQKLFVQYFSTLSASGSSVFIFGPYPDQAYMVEGTYYQTPPLLSSTQTTNWLVTSAPNMLLAACMVKVYEFLKDVQGVQGWTQLYTDRLGKLIAKDRAERYGKGPLVINAR